jgi:hypothetical protein
MTTYKVISGSVQYGRLKMEDKHGKVVYGKPLVADIGQTIDDKQISKESAARLIQLGVLQLVAGSNVTDVEVKSETKATPKGAAKAQTKGAETKQSEAPADKVAESDVPAFLSGT